MWWRRRVRKQCGADDHPLIGYLCASRPPALTAEELLAAVRRLVERPDAATAAVWPRAAVLLARRVLELALAGLWVARPQAADLDGCPTRSRLLCLTAYLDPGTATRAAYLYAALSRAPLPPYELGLTAAEPTRWLNETADLVTLMQARSVTTDGDASGVRPLDSSKRRPLSRIFKIDINVSAVPAVADTSVTEAPTTRLGRMPTP